MRKRKATDANHIGGLLTVTTFRNGKRVRELGPFKNKVVSSDGYGRNLILRALAGDGTYQLKLDSAAIGSNATAAADSDTGLNTSVHSGLAITNFGVANNILTVEVFVPDASITNVTYREFGLFTNGRLFARIVISPTYTKASGEDTLFTYTLTMTG